MYSTSENLCRSVSATVSARACALASIENARGAQEALDEYESNGRARDGRSGVQKFRVRCREARSAAVPPWRLMLFGNAAVVG